MKDSAQHIKRSIQQILLSWEKLVKTEVSASDKTNTLVLYDHLPDILEDISDILERTSNTLDIKKDDKFREIVDNSIYHGRHRASTLDYTVEQVIHEYLLFHQVLADNLRDAGLYSREVSGVLERIVNTAILKSTESFSVALQEMQEKLIGTLAHDIRNPLSAAQLSLQMLDFDTDRDRFDKMKNAAESSVRKALGLIEGLMDAIRIRAGEGISLNFEEAELTEIISYVHQEAGEIYSQSIELQLPETKIYGVFDETALRRLIENFLTNAIKYGDSNSEVSIILEDKGEQVALSVHNFGNPIPKSKQNQIFKFLTKEDQPNHRQSWGMGLSLVKMVAEAHGGFVKLTSTEEEGTVFTAILEKNSTNPGKQRARLHMPSPEQLQRASE